MSEPRTARTSDLASKFNATAAINGGYFNLKDGVSASYVFIDGKMVADPTKNQQLINNPKLTLFLPEIFERTFLRVLAASAGKCSVDIGIKDEKLPVGYAIVHALQGGPRLLPTLEAEGEAFLRTNPDGTVSDSIGVNKEAARTAFGVMADGRAMLLCVAGKGQDQESSGITLAALADLMKRLGCTEAVNLDGGSSTTMVAKLAGSPGKPKLVCGKQPETLVKSILLVRPKLRP